MFIVATIVVIVLFGLIHQTNIISTQDVDLDLASVNVGEARETLSTTLDKETIVSNLLLKISESHTNHKHDTSVSFAFLDENGNVTEDEEEIKSVQFKVELLNKDGQVQSVSRERIEIDSLVGGDN